MANLSQQIKKRGLEVPAVFFLEMHKPLANVAGQASIVFSPFLAPFIGMNNVHDYSRLMMDRENFERLIASIEEKDTPISPDPNGATGTEETDA